jgi:hypothetical protein
MKVEYNNPPIGMDGKFITPFIIVITGKAEEMTIETDDPLEAEYMVTLCKYPEFRARKRRGQVIYLPFAGSFFPPGLGH